MMPLSRIERKERLGFGGQSKIAKRTKRTRGHVSQVVNGIRHDPRVERAVARVLGLPVEEVFPEHYNNPQHAA